MKKELKDYANLYLGCAVQLPVSQNPETNGVIKLTTDVLAALLEFNEWDRCKLLLRPLSDMTAEEAENTLRLNYRYEVIEVWRSSERFISYRFLYTYGKKPRRSPDEKSDFFPVQAKTPEAFRYLLSKGFDLFGLIDAGLAIDKTKI